MYIGNLPLKFCNYLTSRIEMKTMIQVPAYTGVSLSVDVFLLHSNTVKSKCLDSNNDLANCIS